MKMDRAAWRAVDANANRAREGLRVCEEVARFVLANPKLTQRCQRLRYDLSSLIRRFPLEKLNDARDAQGDVGRPQRRGPLKPHKNYSDVVKANSQRVQEALRVLEEFTRLYLPQLGQPCARLRFRVYTLEKDLLQQL